jgi:hypothetical protein
MEHRWGRRVAADVEVQIFADPASAGWGRLRNLSISGGFIETALQVPTLSTLCLTIPATPYQPTSILRAIAVRSCDEGVGVEWFDGGSDAVVALMQAVAPSFARTRVAGEMRL